MEISVRVARLEDMPSLVRLQLANAERHVELDPHGHRLPEPAAVRHYFAELLAEPAVLVLVAEVAGSVAGMAEIVVSAALPDHRSPVPRLTAQVHTVVLETHRGEGIGKALVAAAEQLARQRGVEVLIAPILASNAEAIGFYSRAGFGQHGILLSKKLNGRDGQPGQRG